MDELPIAIVDIVVLGIILISALLSYFRGFFKEVLSLVSWGGAAAATAYGYSYALPYARQLIDVEPFTTIAAATAIFVVALIAISILSNILSSSVQESGVGSVNRSLGFLFGLARGALVICLLYLAATWIWEEDALPQPLQEARTLPITQKGTYWLLSVMPDAIQEKARNAQIETQKKADEVEEAQELYNRLNNLKPGSNDGSATTDGAPDASGYNDQQRKQLDSLIKQAD